MIRHLALATATIALLTGLAACDRPEDSPLPPYDGEPVPPAQSPPPGWHEPPVPGDVPQPPRLRDDGPPGPSAL